MDGTSSQTMVLIGGSSCLFSYLFYSLYQSKKLEIEKIKEIPKYQPNEELLRRVKASPQRRLAYAAVEGSVQPDGNPLASQYIPRCFAVVQKVQVEETWEVWNQRSGTWYRRKMNSKESNNMVPFHLECPGAFTSKMAVKVQSPLEAVGPYLEQVHYRIKYAKDGLVDFVLNELVGEKPFCIEEKEEILRVGTTLTGFGEVVLQQGNVLILQPPTNGQPYLLFPTNYQGYLQSHQDTATMWKVFTAVCGIAGATLIFWALYREYQKYQRKRGRN
ncbi:mitochondrial ubiquitin ligase activator of nfkb 1-A [Conger conger]|nr:mitochondrial ubiquitin ligase activator of nfkb 1-A [Conger conger]XP_061099159.1 mitochondrial ubiquitin ligase activator of nfkb 1-A [Conger conger]